MIKNMMNKKRIWFLLIVMLVLLSVSVSAFSMRSVTSNVLGNIGNFLGRQDSATVKVIDFFVFFIIFTSMGIVGLRNWGDDKTRNATNAIAIAFGLALSTALIWQTKISVKTLFPVAAVFLILGLFLFFFKLFQNLGMKSKFWAFILAVVLTALLVSFFYGWGNFFGGLSASDSPLTGPISTGPYIPIGTTRPVQTNVPPDVPTGDAPTVIPKPDNKPSTPSTPVVVTSTPTDQVPVTGSPVFIKYHEYMQEASKQYNVPICWIYGIMIAESGGRPGLTSFSGYQGLMQAGGTDERDQIMKGTNHLKGKYNYVSKGKNFDKYSDTAKWELAVTAYNAGQGVVIEAMKTTTTFTWQGMYSKITTDVLQKFSTYQDASLLKKDWLKTRFGNNPENYRQNKINVEIKDHHRRATSNYQTCLSYKTKPKDDATTGAMLNEARAICGKIDEKTSDGWLACAKKVQDNVDKQTSTAELRDYTAARGIQLANVIDNRTSPELVRINSFVSQRVKESPSKTKLFGLIQAKYETKRSTDYSNLAGPGMGIGAVFIIIIVVFLSRRKKEDMQIKYFQEIIKLYQTKRILFDKLQSEIATMPDMDAEWRWKVNKAIKENMAPPYSKKGLVAALEEKDFKKMALLYWKDLKRKGGLKREDLVKILTIKKNGDVYFRALTALIDGDMKVNNESIEEYTEKEIKLDEDIKDLLKKSITKTVNLTEQELNKMTKRIEKKPDGHDVNLLKNLAEERGKVLKGLRILNILLKQIKKNVSKDKELITPITNHLVMTRKGQPIVHKLHEKVADYGNSIKAQEALLERLLNVENEIVVTEKKVTKKEAEVKKKEQEKKNTGITLEDWKKNKRPNGYVRTTPMIEKARRHKLKPEQELPAKIQNSYQNLLDNLKNNGKLTKAESKKIAELSQKVSSILELKMELQVLKPNLNVFLNILTKTRDSSYRQALAEFGSLLNEEYRSKLYEIAKTPDKIKPENIIKNINDVLRELDKKVKDKKSKLREVLK